MSVTNGRDREAVSVAFIADLSDEQRARATRTEREKYLGRMRGTTPLPGLASLL